MWSPEHVLEDADQAFQALLPQVALLPQQARVVAHVRVAHATPLRYLNHKCSARCVSNGMLEKETVQVPPRSV